MKRLLQNTLGILVMIYMCVNVMPSEVDSQAQFVIRCGTNYVDGAIVPNPFPGAFFSTTDNSTTYTIEEVSTAERIQITAPFSEQTVRRVFAPLISSDGRLIIFRPKLDSADLVIWDRQLDEVTSIQLTQGELSALNERLRDYRNEYNKFVWISSTQFVLRHFSSTISDQLLGETSFTVSVNPLQVVRGTYQSVNYPNLSIPPNNQFPIMSLSPSATYTSLLTREPVPNAGRSLHLRVYSASQIVFDYPPQHADQVLDLPVWAANDQSFFIITVGESETSYRLKQIVAPNFTENQYLKEALNNRFGNNYTIIPSFRPTLNADKSKLGFQLEDLASNIQYTVTYNLNTGEIIAICNDILLPDDVVATLGYWEGSGRYFAVVNTYTGIVLVDTVTGDTYQMPGFEFVGWIELIPSSSGTGLRGRYFNNADLTAPVLFRINPRVDFNWGTGTPDTAIAADTFSVRWSGRVEPLYTETYTFHVTHNDGARLWVNGQQIINNWANQSAAVESSGTIALSAGVEYDLVLEYYENTGNAQIRLEWSSARQVRGVIPASQLYPPEGQLAFRGTEAGNQEIFIRNPDGSGEINVSNSSSSDHSPVWSPDGTRIAFVSARDGNEELYLVNADGTGLRRLTNHTGADNQPAWSPDGNKLAFISTRTGAGDVYIIDVTGTGIPTATRRVSSTYTEADPMWSTNGLFITYEAYVSSTYGVEIFIVSSVSGNPIRLTTRAGIDAAPVWSPDGSKIAFRAPFNGSDQIWIANTTSPYALTRLTSTGVNYFQSWSPDSTKILFQSTRDGNVEVYTMNADGSSQTRLTNSASGESYAVWSADARQIAFVRSSDL